jgi:hypothetical protein
MAIASKKTTTRTVKTAAKTTQPATRKAAPARKTALPAPTKAAPPKTARAADETKAVKPKKPKLVRDSFTIPKAEYAVLDELKQRAVKLAHPVKKSELLRAGIKALTAMSDAALLAALKAVPAIKTGRPKKD